MKDISVSLNLGTGKIGLYSEDMNELLQIELEPNDAVLLAQSLHLFHLMAHHIKSIKESQNEPTNSKS